MWTYLIVFGISTVLFAISGKITNKTIKWILAIISCLLPCALAGLRAETIGTDVLVYAKPMANVAAHSHSFADYWQSGFQGYWKYEHISQYEIGFSFLVYSVVKIFKSLNWVLFFIQALTIFPVFFGLKHFEKSAPVWQGMAVFFLLNYNISLNMMRQWIAMAILIYGYKYIADKKFIKYLICVAVAVLFHTSALLGIFIWFIFKFVQGGKINLIFSNKLKINKSLRVIEIALMAIVILALMPTIANLLGVIGLSRYSLYISGSIDISLNQIMIRLPVFILAVLSWRSLSKKNEFAQFYMSMILLEIIFSQLVSVNIYATRISIYFSEYSLLYIPAIANASDSKYVRLFEKGIFAAYLLAYWFYYFAISGIGETVPYAFA